MAYDKNKDRLLKEWRIPVTDTTTAVVSLKTYAGGTPKLQISVLEIQKQDGGVVFAKMRRWGWDELHDLRDVIDQAIDLMDDLESKRKKTA